ncbi:DUF1176 domain-containing protein [Stenotrophomonas sp. NPDC077659]|uniref:DUF1176 domain-containing protein n=1 Tax=Stenotrophomonas sp. NPDC077659 TaxID=3390694 RepID=UPI003CFE657E
MGAHSLDECVPGTCHRCRRVENCQRFTETTFYRGGGDCGHATSWRWDGAAFRPETVQLQPDCLGGEPGDWPTVFRTAGSPVDVARESGPPRDTPAPEPR